MNNPANSASNLLQLIRFRRNDITHAMMFNVLDQIENNSSVLYDLTRRTRKTEQEWRRRINSLRQEIENGNIDNDDLMNDLKTIAISIERVRRRAVVFQLPRFRLTQGDLEDISLMLHVSTTSLITYLTFIYLPLQDQDDNSYIWRIAASVGSFVSSAVIYAGIQRAWTGRIPEYLTEYSEEDYIEPVFETNPIADAPEHTTKDDECLICLKEFNYNHPRVRVFVCDHAYHFECIKEWMKINPRCPQCRENRTITPPKMYRFSFYSPEPLTIDIKEKYTLQMINKMDKLINLLESPKTSKDVKSFIELTILMLYIKTLVIFKEKYNMKYEETVRLMGL
jgi:hypothetical protein